MTALALAGEAPAWLSRALAERAPAAAGEGAVAFWAAGEAPSSWPQARAGLLAAFTASRAAAGGVFFIVQEADLFGLRGAPAAMLACGLLSAARAVAVEGARDGRLGATISIDDSTSEEALVDALTAAVAGNHVPALLPLGRTHLGRALP